METKFYYCPICGNLILKVEDSGVTPHCCGQAMTLLFPNTHDGAKEKHLPVVELLDGRTLRVKVGSQPHPMTSEHHIEFICLETPAGIQIRRLDASKPAVADFACPIAFDFPIKCHPDEAVKAGAREPAEGECACGDPACACDDSCECKGGDEPCPCPEMVIAAYEYCNLHGLWKSEWDLLSGELHEKAKVCYETLFNNSLSTKR